MTKEFGQYLNPFLTSSLLQNLVAIPATFLSIHGILAENRVPHVSRVYIGANSPRQQLVSTPKIMSSLESYGPDLQQVTIIACIIIPHQMLKCCVATTPAVFSTNNTRIVEKADRLLQIIPQLGQVHI